MTSTTVGDAPVTASDDPDAKISRTIDALLGYHGLKRTDLPKRIEGLKQATLYTRLNGERAWEAREVAIIAKLFGLPVGQFYEGRPQLDDSHLSDEPLRLSRDPDSAGQDPFSGCDIDRLITASAGHAA